VATSDAERPPAWATSVNHTADLVSLRELLKPQVGGQSWSQSRSTLTLPVRRTSSIAHSILVGALLGMRLAMANGYGIRRSVCAPDLRPKLTISTKYLLQPLDPHRLLVGFPYTDQRWAHRQVG